MEDFPMIASMDTSYDYDEKVLFILLLLMRNRKIVQSFLREISKGFQQIVFHFRELSAKQKSKVLMGIDEVIEKYKGSLSLIVIKVNVKKGLTLRKRIALENFIYIILRGAGVQHFYCPSDLDTKHYKLSTRLKYKLRETEIHTTDNDATIQLADILVNWYRKRRKRIEGMISVKTHHC